MGRHPIARCRQQRHNVDIAVNVVGPAVQQHDRRTIALSSFSVSNIQDTGIDLFQRAEGLARPVPHHTCHLSAKTLRRNVLYYKDDVTQESLERHTIPQTLHSTWTRRQRIQHFSV